MDLHLKEDFFIWRSNLKVVLFVSSFFLFCDFLFLFLILVEKEAEWICTSKKIV